MSPSQMTQTVTLKSVASRSSAGDPTYGSASTLSARVQPGKSRDFATIAHTHVVYSMSEIKVDDLVWFPGDDTSDLKVGRRALAVRQSPHPTDGTTLYKAAF